MNILIVKGGEWHPFDVTTKMLSDWLTSRRSDVSVRVVEGCGGINEENLEWADIVVINHQGSHDKLSEEQGQMLWQFVSGGKGLVGIHSAADSFKNNKRYMELIGCKFITHGPPASVRILLTEPSHQITAHTEDGFTIFDEIYQCEVIGSPRILAKVRWEGREYPMVTINEIGKGRVFYLALGHDEKSWSDENFQVLLMRGIDWVRFGNVEKRIGCGLVGVSPRFDMGLHHGGQILKSYGLELVAACDVVKENLVHFKQTYDWVKAYTDIDELLADKDIDLVTLITPHNTHYELAKKSLLAGKHVIVEKPFVLKYDQAVELMEIAEANSLLVTCYQNRRFDWQCFLVKKLIDEGRIGKPFYARITIGSYRMPQDSWRAYKSVSGGHLYDWGAHHVDWLLTWMGYEAISVYAAVQKRRWFWADNEDHANLMIKFKDESVAEYMNTTLYPAFEGDYIIVAGSEGSIRIPHGSDKLILSKYADDGRKLEEQIISGEEHGKQWIRFYRNIADNLLFGEPLLVKPQESAMVIRIIESAYESAISGKAVMLG